MTRALAGALAPLAAYPQFTVCKLVPRADKPGKTDKLPCNVWEGRVGVDAHDPKNWLPLDVALVTLEKWGPDYCLAFTLTRNDPFWAVDIDDALTPQGWSALSQHLVGMFPGAAVEISQSGRGLHIFGSGRAPEHGCKNVPLGIEFYTEARFMAINCFPELTQGSAALDFTAQLSSLVEQFFPAKVRAEGAPDGWTEGPSSDWRGPADDEELLRRALASHSARSSFGNAASFADLWTGDAAALARAYPSDADDYDRSSADAALAQHLAFWTGRDCSRIERLMRRSALARDKWDRDDYLGPRTIMNAVRMQRDVLQDKAPEPPPGPAPVAGAAEAVQPQEVQGSTFLSPADQVALFKGCVYVASDHRIWVPGGHMLNEGRFNVRYGGYTFAMDARNERTVRKAWEAFTESQVLRRPIADDVCFKPQRAPGELVEVDGRVLVNTFWPATVARSIGDPGPFIRHLAKLLPDERDRSIVLYYMAAMVQHQGVKFQWAPVIQGVPGNGKTLLNRAVEAAIGQQFCHWPPADELTAKFNAWMYGHTAILVEDIHIKRGGQIVDTIEALKPMITNDRYTVEMKGVDQKTVEVCCNYMFNMNHRDGLPKMRDDRRFAPFFTPQQTAADLARDGMTGNYFRDLYDWFKGPGRAIVAEMLWTLPIPDEFNPATGCQRAPQTSSTDQAIAESLGNVEQEILEAIEQGTPGFKGGWVSSLQLDVLLERINRGGVPRTKRRALMQSLGYDWHPALRDGRVNDPVLPDGGKPRLYVRPGSPESMIAVAAEVARAYTAAQTGIAARV